MVQPTADAVRAQAFTAAVSAITDAFGDPTRRRIYLFTRDHGGDDGVTASAVAAEVGVHPNVARHHLDKLAAGGYVEVVAARAPASGAGPVARRSATSPSPAGVRADVPVRSDDLVLALLGRALDRLPHARGRGDGRGGRRHVRPGDGRRAHRRRARRRAALAALGDAGRRRRPDGARLRRPHGGRRASDGLRIINDHCPFGTVATDHPVICAVDRGMVRGMLSALYGHGDDVEVATEASKARGDTFCATAV